MKGKEKNMFWDRAADYYDFFETLYNGKVYKELGERVSAFVEPNNFVLECACGTGCITKSLAAKCSFLVATDYSEGMLGKAEKACKNYRNIRFSKGDINRLRYTDETFDKVVAGNVIHLLDEPKAALDELMRVCKPGGLIIVPTYVNITPKGKPSLMVKCLEKMGVNFKRQFSPESYQEFFTTLGYEPLAFSLVEGKMPCCIAVLQKAA